MPSTRTGIPTWLAPPREGRGCFTPSRFYNLNNTQPRRRPTRVVRLRHARIPPSTLVVEDRSPTSGGDEFGSSDEDTDWRSARAKLENLERRTGCDTLVFGRVASRHLCLGLFSKVLVFAGLLWFGVTRFGFMSEGSNQAPKIKVRARFSAHSAQVYDEVGLLTPLATPEPSVPKSAP